jgi:hypothetical protein
MYGFTSFFHVPLSPDPDCYRIVSEFLATCCLLTTSLHLSVIALAVESAVDFCHNILVQMHTLL